MQLGTQLNGLSGNIDIPKQNITSSGYWIGEDGEASKEDIDFGLISLKPKTVANYVEITRRLIMQSSLSVELLVRNDLAAGLARTIDKTGFYGDGTANAPIGIKHTAGIHNMKFSGDQLLEDPTQSTKEQKQLILFSQWRSILFSQSKLLSRDSKFVTELRNHLLQEDLYDRPVRSWITYVLTLF